MGDDSEECGHMKNDGERCTFSAKYSDGKCGHHTDEKGPEDRGRPTKLTKQREEQIASAIENGRSMTSAARMAGVSRNAVYSWIEKAKTKRKAFMQSSVTHQPYGQHLSYSDRSLLHWQFVPHVVL